MACKLSELPNKAFNTAVVKIACAHYKISMYLIASSDKFKSQACHKYRRHWSLCIQFGKYNSRHNSSTSKTDKNINDEKIVTKKLVIE